MEKLRIDTGVKKIEVNDAGECITVNMADNAFFTRFRDFLNRLEEEQLDIDRKVKEFSAKYPDSDKEDEENNTNMLFDMMDTYKEVCDWTCAELDKLFGAGCCRKVFPDLESPGMDLIGDFLEAVTPILQKFANERNEKINLRYNRNRKGARSE